MDNRIRMPGHANFATLDALDESSWSKHAKYFNADTLTMIYFLSEVLRKQGRSREMLQTRFRQRQTWVVALVR